MKWQLELVWFEADAELQLDLVALALNRLFATEITVTDRLTFPNEGSVFTSLVTGDGVAEGA